MKSLTLAAMCIFINVGFSQEVVVEAPPSFHNPNEINKTMPAPIDVVVPYHQEVPKTPVVEQVNKIYETIKGSVFFLEVNPVNITIVGGDFESNNLTNDKRDLEMEVSGTKFQLMPLNFKFGFENTGWGSFAKVNIEDNDNDSELVIYGKAGSHKFGFGLQLKSVEADLDLKVYGVKKIDTNAKESVLSPYFYYSLAFADNESLIFEQWMKIGAAFSNKEQDDVRIKGVAFVIRPAFDLMFKINPKLQIGTGVEFEYQRFSGKVEAPNINTFEGVGNSFQIDFNLIKTRFIF